MSERKHKIFHSTGFLLFFFIGYTGLKNLCSMSYSFQKRGFIGHRFRELVVQCFRKRKVTGSVVLENRIIGFTGFEKVKIQGKNGAY